MGSQYVVGLANVGISVVDCTIVAMDATAMTDAELIAAPPNTGASGIAGPIVHSLGVAPTVALLQPIGGSVGSGAQALFMTADNSAVYFRVTSWTQTSLGYAVRAIAIR